MLCLYCLIYEMVIIGQLTLGARGTNTHTVENLLVAFDSPKVSRYLQGIGSRTPMDAKTQRRSSSIYKMVEKHMQLTLCICGFPP